MVSCQFECTVVGPVVHPVVGPWSVDNLCAVASGQVVCPGLVVTGPFASAVVGPVVSGPFECPMLSGPFA